MCGLAGFAGDGNTDDLIAMTRALAHRGPDSEGFHQDSSEAVYLGHRRLIILDEDGGAQPMWNEDHRVAVVFNGEIYNHRELRHELEACGHQFQSDHSDTEVLVHGYEEWGTELPNRLNGMFAFAVLDYSKGQLFLARDRFGEKPLFYAQRQGLFAFASEADALVRHQRLNRTVRAKSVQKLFAYGYLPGETALYEHTCKLPPGTWLTYRWRDAKLQKKRYWRFRLNPDSALESADEDVLAERLWALLQQATQRRMEADRPLGLFLSGGVDSSSILASVLQARTASEINTFTIGFDQASFDESQYAAKLVEQFQTRHRSRTIDLETARDALPELLGSMDEPLGDPSLLPTSLLCELTREHVSVALSGDGGDELLAGYDPFRALAPARLYARIVPRSMHRGLRRLVDVLPLSDRNMSLDFKLRRALTGLSYRDALWNPVWMSPVEPGLMHEIMHDPLPAEEIYEEALTLWESSTQKGLLERSLEFFTNLYLPDNILTKLDRSAMRVSLESRTVFLDNDLADFFSTLPSRYKFRDGRGKYLLKRAMRSHLPEWVLSRPKKGFGIPLRKWMREIPAEFPLPPGESLQGFKLDSIRKRYDAHQAGRIDDRFLLWNWWSLQKVLSANR